MILFFLFAVVVIGFMSFWLGYKLGEAKEHPVKSPGFFTPMDIAPGEYRKPPRRKPNETTKRG